MMKLARLTAVWLLNERESGRGGGGKESPTNDVDNLLIEQQSKISFNYYDL